MHSWGSHEASGSSEEAYLPIASYFSFSKAETDTKRLQVSEGKLRDESPNLRGVQSDGPPKSDDMNAFTHRRTTQKSRRRIPMRTRQTPKNTLVLELQEKTLAVSSLTAHWDDASTFAVPFQGKLHQVSIKLRPHLEEFLKELAKIYEVFVFTTAKQDYADKILEAFGPQRKLIRHQLYQEDCLCSQGFYIKDLSVLERDLARTVAVANDLEEFPYQTSNVILIPKWMGRQQDEELLHLIPVLKDLGQMGDVRAEIERRHHGKPKEKA